MKDIEYANAYTEVLEIIKYIPESDYEKIPTKYLKVFNNYSNDNYLFKYNPKKTLDEQKVSKKAKEIIALLYRNFWASSEKKYKILNYQKNERIQIEKEKQREYSSNKIVAKIVTQDQSAKNNNEASLVQVKETFFMKFINFIKKVFKTY